MVALTVERIFSCVPMVGIRSHTFRRLWKTENCLLPFAFLPYFINNKVAYFITYFSYLTPNTLYQTKLLKKYTMEGAKQPKQIFTFLSYLLLSFVVHMLKDICKVLLLLSIQRFAFPVRKQYQDRTCPTCFSNPVNFSNKGSLYPRTNF